MSRFNVANAGWSPDALAWLRDNWMTNTKGELALVLGCTPNAVVGKAHRLDLPKKQGTPKKLEAPRIHRPHRKLSGASKPKRKSPAKPKAPPRSPFFGRPYDGGGCAWPFGDPGERGFCLCGSDPVNQSPYCDEHYKRAYIPRRRPLIAEGVPA